MMDEKYCEGGEAYAEGGEVDSDTENLMDHCGMEMMHAIEGKDVKSFRDSFHVLVAHTLNKMGIDQEDGDDAEGDE